MPPHVVDLVLGIMIHIGYTGHRHLLVFLGEALVYFHFLLKIDPSELVDECHLHALEKGLRGVAYNHEPNHSLWK